MFPGDLAMECRHCLVPVVLFTSKLINHKYICVYVTCSLHMLSYNNNVTLPQHLEHPLSSPGNALLVTFPSFFFLHCKGNRSLGTINYLLDFLQCSTTDVHLRGVHRF